jgi:hypothetical protein
MDAMTSGNIQGGLPPLSRCDLDTVAVRIKNDTFVVAISCASRDIGYGIHIVFQTLSQEAQLAILIGSLLVPGVGIAILRTAKVPPWSAMLGVPGLSQKAASGLSTCFICEVDQPPLVKARYPPVCA